MAVSNGFLCSYLSSKLKLYYHDRIPLRISDDNDFQIHLRRPTDSCFVNNYFKEGLLAWEANIDIQPVLNHYKAITYMCAYLSKTEDECSQAMHHAIKEAHENDLDKCHEMRSIAHAYATKRECSVQEAVYNIMPELWLRKVFPGVLFANNNVPEERYRMCLTEDEIRDLPEESIEIFKRNMIDRYIDRPSQTFANGKFRILDSFCYAEFLINYYIAPKPVENDCQPEELIGQVIERNHSPSPYPKVIPLMSSKEKLKCRQTEVVLRYHVPNKDMYSEKYAHHLLFLFYPFRNETALKSGEPPTYKNKLCETGVIDVINHNKSFIEPYAELVDIAFARFREDLATNLGPYGQQENDDVDDLVDQLSETEISDNDCEDQLDNTLINDPTISTTSTEVATVLPDDVINQIIRSLNLKQRQMFNKVHKWARDYIKNLSCKTTKELLPFHIFLTGDGGAGKSHLVKTIYHAMHKLLLRHGGSPEKARILLLAPTGVAAININGTTIHSGLCIPCRGTCYPLNDKNRVSLRNKLSEVQMIIIDEISMVSSKLFFAH